MSPEQKAVIDPVIEIITLPLRRRNKHFIGNTRFDPSIFENFTNEKINKIIASEDDENM